MPIPVFSKWYIVLKKVIRSLNWRRQTIQWPKEKQSNNDLQNTTLKTKE